MSSKLPNYKITTVQKWWKRPGWKSSLRIAFFFAFLFTLLSTGIYHASLYFLTQTLRNAELKEVRNQALEYRSWFLSGQLRNLEARMNEQHTAAEDIIFVHLQGPQIDYIKFNSGKARTVPANELHQMSAAIQGTDIMLGGQTWTVASLPLARTDNQDLLIQVGKNHAASNATLAAFRSRFLKILIPGTFLATLVGTLGVYRTLAPIRRLTTGMRRILRNSDQADRIATHKKQRDELNHLITLFNQLLDRNQQVTESMRESLDHLAHDFRTPLNRIRLSAERALSSGREQDLSTSLQDAAEEAAYLDNLLTALMNVAEAESGALALSVLQVPIKTLFQEIADLYEFTAEDKNISLLIEAPSDLILKADKTRLTQALANLLDNALKYSPKNTSVTLQARLLEDNIVLEIIDQGPGISEEDQDHLFTRLYRGDKSRHTPGIGLGLNLVKAIVEAHQGTITLTNEFPGVRARITFPA